MKVRLMEVAVLKSKLFNRECAEYEIRIKHGCTYFEKEVKKIYLELRANCLTIGELRHKIDSYTKEIRFYDPFIAAYIENVMCEKLEKEIDNSPLQRIADKD